MKSSISILRFSITLDSWLPSQDGFENGGSEISWYSLPICS